MKIKNRKNNFEKDKNSVTLYHGGCCCCCCCCINTTTSSIFAYKTFLKDSKHRGWWTFLLFLLLGSIEFFVGGFLITDKSFEHVYPIATIIITLLLISAYNSFKYNKKFPKR